MTQFQRQLTFMLVTLLPIGVLASGCAPDVSSKGQMITCSTDPGTGVILACEPGGGGGSGTCQDVDVDGDGEPHDEDLDPVLASEDDDDGDGVSNDDDCDEEPGEDDCNDHSEIDLPYDIKLQVGDTTKPILDAFAEKGAAPAVIVSVTMDGGDWRLSELQSGTSFTVTDDDCGHAGNRDTGRDRVVVTWQNADGSTDSDHLDLRYCE